MVHEGNLKHMLLKALTDGKQHPVSLSQKTSVL